MRKSKFSETQIVEMLKDAESAEMRSRVEVGDRIARRVMEMTPGERRQFERLMSLPAGPARPSR